RDEARRRDRGRQEEDAARDAIGTVSQGVAELFRIPLRRLTGNGKRETGTGHDMRHRDRHPITRRDALCRMGNGFGMLAFASLANSLELAAQTTGLHHPAKAKHVIFLFMNGGLSQVDSFDPKPMLEKYHGQPLPGGSIATERKTGSLMKSPFAFKKYGKSGLEVSDLFPMVGAQADDICVIRSMYTDIPNHEPSLLMMNTGHTQVGRPSMGAW